MMINRKIFCCTSSRLLLVVLVVTAGCGKYLDQHPDMRTELDNPEKVGELLATAYPQANYIPFAEAISDNVDDKGAGAISLINSAPFRFEDVPDNGVDAPIFYWNASYQAIAAANHALEAIGKAANPEDYRAYRGEALVARAYAHFMLVNLFARPYAPQTAASDPGIPYVTTVGKTVIAEFERKTVAYVYSMVEKDLQEGLPLIDDSKYSSPKYHFTKVAAHAFASRFYLFKQDFAAAISHADEAFPGNSVTASLRPINSESYRSLQYNELQAQYTRADNPANLLLVEAPSLWGRSYAGYRYGFTTGLMQRLITTSTPVDGPWAYNLYGNELALNIPKFREHFVRQGLHAETGVPYNMIPLFTAEEVLFNRAESAVMLGDYGSAIADLNRYASTRFIYSAQIPVYVPELQDMTVDKLLAFYQTRDQREALLSCILYFKRVNFLFEGQRWFDLIRHNLPVEHMTSDGKQLILGPNDPMRVFQLPEEVQRSGIQLNPR